MRLIGFILFGVLFFFGIWMLCQDKPTGIIGIALGGPLFIPACVNIIRDPSWILGGNDGAAPGEGGF